MSDFYDLYIDSLVKLLNANEETIGEAERLISPFLEDINSIEIFFLAYFNNSDKRIRHSSLVFLYKVVHKFVEKINPETLKAIKDGMMKIISKEVDKMDFEVIGQLMDDICALCVGDEKWDELNTFLFQNYTNLPLLTSFIFKKITKYVSSFLLTETSEHINDALDFYFNFNDEAVVTSAVVIFTSLLNDIEIVVDDGTVEDVLNSQNRYDAILQLMERSITFSDQNFDDFWSCITEITAKGSAPSTVMSSLIGGSFVLANNTELVCSRRYSIISATVNNISLLTNDHMNSILTVCIEILAKSIAETEGLPFHLLGIFEHILNCDSHETIYPILNVQLMEALHSNVTEFQCAALLVLKVVLTNAPSCAEKDSDKISSILIQALDSQNSNLIHSALSVLESFHKDLSSFKLNIVDYIIRIVKFITASETDIKTTAYDSILVLCSNLDCKIDDFFPIVFGILARNQHSISGFTRQYFQLLAFSVEYSTEFNDEHFNALLQFLESVVNTDLYISGHALTVAEVLIRLDEEYLSSVMNLFAPVIHSCLEFENMEVKECALIFLVNYVSSTKCSIVHVLSYVDYVMSMIKDKSNANIVRSDALHFLSVLIHFNLSSNKALVSILDQIQNMILELIKTDMQNNVIISVKALAKYLKDELRIALFNIISEFIMESLEITFVSDCIKTLSNLVKYAKESQLETLYTKAVELFNNIISGKITITGEKELLDIDNSTAIVSAACYMIEQLLVINVNFGSIALEFIMKLLGKNSSLDKSKAIEVLSDMIGNDVVMQEDHPKIFQIICDLTPEATQPALKNNIVHILNTFMVKDQSFVKRVFSLIETFRSWWNNALQRPSGNQDLIANLSGAFVTLAIYLVDFPTELLIQVIDIHPQNSEAIIGPLTMNLVFYSSEIELSQELRRSFALAYGRLLSYDKANLSRMCIDSDLKETVKDQFKNLIAQDKEALPILISQISGNNSKVERIKALL